MKTVEIVETFSGYPGKEEVRFAAGDVVEVSDAFAELIIEKGHAKASTKKPASEKEAEA